VNAFILYLKAPEGSWLKLWGCMRIYILGRGEREHRLTGDLACCDTRFHEQVPAGRREPTRETRQTFWTACLYGLSHSGGLQACWLNEESHGLSREECQRRFIVAKRYSAPPAMQIDPSKKYTAIFHTAKGDITVELFADKAPVTVNNFVFLAREGFYNGTTFHRVIGGFMAQGGDPTGTGAGGPGYQFNDEKSALELKHDSAGILSMANAGENTNGSQFFITYAPQPHLNGKHAVFGKVTTGMDVLKSIRERDPRFDRQPGDAINSIEITES
jgi:cyclophilin family peptidyl-prolyl cis-trans isomerase